MAVRHEQHTGARTLVLVVLPWRAVRRRLRLRSLGCRLNERHARSENFEAILGYSNHRRFQAHFTGTAIEQKRGFVTKGFTDVLGCRWRKLREAIGARRGNRHTWSVQQCEGHGMPRHTQSHRGQARGHLVGNHAFLGYDQRQGTRPVLSRQLFCLFGPVGSQFAGLLGTRHVDEQRAGPRPALQLINLANGGRVQCIGAASIYWFCWEHGQAARADNLRPLPNIVIVYHGVRSIAADLCGLLPVACRECSASFHQRVVAHIKPAEYAVDNHPQNGVMSAPRQRDSQHAPEPPDPEPGGPPPVARVVFIVTHDNPPSNGKYKIALLPVGEGEAAFLSGGVDLAPALDRREQLHIFKLTPRRNGACALARRDGPPDSSQVLRGKARPTGASVPFHRARMA